MKRIKAALLIIAMIVGLVFTSNKEVKAAEEIQCVDGSYLIEDEYSEGEAINKTRGIYLKSGTSSISKVDTGKIAAGGRTVAQMTVSKISVTVCVERLVNGSWVSYTSFSGTKYNAVLASASKTLSVPIGYYYRVCCSHRAESDVSDSYTDGIHI
ncbi:DUF6147 family protein [Bariatricus sp. HCP3S3_E12]|uniref:DUF6147 family protein n=1 Tax=Bariatricus sp. HCP3S3_E12 TaxID=3438906 RepID=UPI003F897B51